MTCVQGFVTAVPTANKEKYRKQASDAAPLLKQFGAKRMVEGWRDDVPDGKATERMFWGGFESILEEQGEGVRPRMLWAYAEVLRLVYFPYRDWRAMVMLPASYAGHLPLPLVHDGTRDRADRGHACRRCVQGSGVSVETVIRPQRSSYTDGVRGRPAGGWRRACDSERAQRTGGALRIAFAAGLALYAAAGAALATGQKPATMYALNCMGCHQPPKERQRDAGPLRGEFFHSTQGRSFYVRMPVQGRSLSAAEDARLLEEILTWRRSCTAVIQSAPTVDHRGDRSVR